MVGLPRVVLAFCFAVVAAFSPVVENARSFAAFGTGVAFDTTQNPSPDAPLREWIDPATGHRVVRLSDAAGSASLYFHQNQYTATGDKMVFSTREGLSTINHETRRIEAIVEGRAGKVVVGKKTRRVFYHVQFSPTDPTLLMFCHEGPWHKIERESWSVHYNSSPDGKLFAGDGGGPRSVAAPGNGQWIYLFTPNGSSLKVERLVDLSKHDYRLEPNVSFTPDGKWIVFRSNMHGASHVYAVEVKKGKR